MLTESEFGARLRELRALYVRATPRQRYSVAKQRMTRPQDGPNTLVACVSAVEGFARCLAMHQVADSKDALEQVYPEYRDLGATDLITRYLSRIGQVPDAIFGEGAWSDFGYAVRYRNLLAHEATYLGQDISPRLINACEVIIEKLAQSAGVADAA
jgi:hypothetical protein